MRRGEGSVVDREVLPPRLRRVMMMVGDGGGGGTTDDTHGGADGSGTGGNSDGAMGVGGDPAGGSGGQAGQASQASVWSKAAGVELRKEDAASSSAKGYDWKSDPLKLGEIRPEGGVAFLGKFTGATALEAAKKMEVAYSELEKKLGARSSIPDKYDFAKGEALVPGAEEQAGLSKEFSELGFTQAQADWVMQTMVDSVRNPSVDDLIADLSEDWLTDEQGALQRLKANEVYWRATLGEKNWNVIRDSPATATAEGMQVLDQLRVAAAGVQLWDFGGNKGNDLIYTKSQLREFQAQLSGMSQGQPGYSELQKKIRAGFSNLYGDAPIMEVGG